MKYDESLPPSDHKEWAEFCTSLELEGNQDQLPDEWQTLQHMNGVQLGSFAAIIGMGSPEFCQRKLPETIAFVEANGFEVLSQDVLPSYNDIRVAFAVVFTCYYLTTELREAIVRLGCRQT